MIESGWTLLLTGAMWMLFSYNAVRPHYTRAAVAAISFFAGWLRAELALHVLLFEALLLGVLVWNGALRTWPGGVGVAFYGISMWLLILTLQKSFVSGSVIDTALVGFAEDMAAPMKLPWRLLLFPFLLRDAKVERLANRVYYAGDGVRLALDIYRRKSDPGSPPPARRPVLLFVHGGAWMIGSKTFQGLPMLQHFAALGWVCFSINYRLSPRATFPDHIVDVKRAIVWIREHASEYGVRSRLHRHLGELGGRTPRVAGGADAERCQPAAGLRGREHVDRRLSVVLRRLRSRGPVRALAQPRLARSARALRDEGAPRGRRGARFEAASPLSHVGAHAPPFLVVHGDHDTIVPVAEARMFVQALRRATAAACIYIEVPGAQHAFEVFPSVRTVHLLRGLERFAIHVHRQHLARDGRAQ